ncbi:MAG TPA: hypothetical protein VLU47_09465, partial [Blastocatellia bacterium]|nr:hypothetical protein [Blastocatellia bacterium]
ALIDAEPALAAAVAARVVDSGPDLIFAARAPAAVAGFVAASGLALIFFEPVLAAAHALVVVAFHADRAFALPAILAAHRPLC